MTARKRKKRAPKSDVIGRPPQLFSPEQHARLIASLRGGAPFNISCIVADISVRTAHSWLKMAKRSKREPYRSFLHSVQKGLAEAEVFHVANITQVARGKPSQEKRKEETLPDGTKVITIEKLGGMAPQWTASAWWLERVKPDRYARRETTRHEGGDENRPVVFQMTLDRDLDAEKKNA